ncbi:MAG TPA: trimeric intracellular cation channel family protein [Gemmatimonadaceae bacterium]|nr:trimeric intracellular cation channel family protein [Gemmatimonadaceae bacterium]
MNPSQYVNISTMVLVLDLCGTFVFALSGAMAGIKHRLDFFGVLVLSFAAANSGGIIRDVLIGAVPPPGISDWRYFVVPVLAGMAMFRWGPIIRRVERAVQLFDAGGLALFAVSGAQKALDFHLGPVSAVLLGMLTGIGGGIVRDLLSAQIPSVLRADVYAVAAMAGAAVVVVARILDFHSIAATVIGATLCFGLRYFALSRGWQLPEARWHDRPNGENG